MAKENTVHIHNGILVSYHKGTKEYHLWLCGWNQSCTERQTLIALPCVWMPRNQFHRAEKNARGLREWVGKEDRTAKPAVGVVK